EQVCVHGTQSHLEAFWLAADDVKEAGRITEVGSGSADELHVDVVLSEAEQTG
ncbi:MAG: hypothetical protein QOH64_2970, partial [Acidimicrobiaceae bacterium]